MRKTFTLLIFMGILLNICFAQQMVTSTNPAHNESGVSKNTPISISFSDSLKNNLINCDIKIYGTQSGLQFAKNFEYSDDFKTIFFRPKKNFYTGETITITVVYIDQKKSFEIKYSWQFSIGVRGGADLNDEEIQGYGLPFIYASDVADINMDGYVDLVFCSRFRVHLYLNDGTGNFIYSNFASAGTMPEAVAIADFDNDFDLDIVAVNSFSSQDSSFNVMGTISLIENTGSGILSAQGPLDVGYGLTSILCMDVENDGDQDIVVTGQNSIFIVLNKDGLGKFEVSREVGVGSYLSSICSADWNNDGYLDIAVSSLGSNAITVLLNNRDTSFVPTKDIFVEHSPQALKAVDFNQDLQMDMLVLNENSHTFSIIYNKGNFEFETRTIDTPNRSPKYSTIGDFDNNGLTDFAIACRPPGLFFRKFFIYYQIYPDSFSCLTKETEEAQYHNAILSGDWDNDGDIDLAIPHGNHSNKISFFENSDNQTVALPAFKNYSKEFSLAQNFPNPFNNTTKIEFSIEKATHVKLKIYDAGGRLIKTLLNKILQSGEYSIRWQPVNLASGVYFYMLQTSKYHQTKQVLLLK